MSGSPFARVTSMVLLALFFLVCASFQTPAIQAAAPSSGTLSKNGGPLSWTGFAGPGAAPTGEAECVEGVNCDTFVLKLAPGDYTGIRVRYFVSWSISANDYDVYVHAGSNSGTLLDSATGSAPETSEAGTFDINAVVQAGVNDTYTIHVVYFLVGPADPYQGSLSLESIPVNAPRVAKYVSGAKIRLRFSRNRTLFAHGTHRDLEPSARVDFQGNAFVGAIRGLSAGDDLWRFDLNPLSSTYDPFLRAAAATLDNNGNIVNPSYKGQPDGISLRPAADTGGDGGGDMDMAVASQAAPGRPPTLALASLVAANISVQQSTTRGDTYTKDPAGNVTVVEDDRPWLEALGANTVYLAYRELAGFQITAHFYVNRSDDGGLTYGPAVLASTGGNTTADISVDQNDGTVYFCHQGPGAQNNQVQIAVGHPRAALLPPTEADYTTYVAATGKQSNIAFLFPVCKVAADGTVYVTYSDGGTNIFLTHSLDQGKTWAQPVRVSNLRAPSSSLFPWMTTGAQHGSVGIAWYGVEGPDSEDGLGA
ncbi:MAG TPA: hypothetical protein VHM88_09575, partial [Candidatus Acidoferrales bacterium]|nr:hypothetical protein [Candidatus Acidoferrales bacterium]